MLVLCMISHFCMNSYLSTRNKNLILKSLNRREKLIRNSVVLFEDNIFKNSLTTLKHYSALLVLQQCIIHVSISYFISLSVPVHGIHIFKCLWAALQFLCGMK